MSAWIRIQHEKNPLREWAPSDIVRDILERASKYKALDYEQARSIAIKACHKYSGNWSHTLKAVLDWQCEKYSAIGCRMKAGRWDMTKFFEQEERERQEAKRKELFLDVERATFDAKINETPYSSLGKWDKTFWQTSYEEKLVGTDKDCFLSSELEEDAPYTRVDYCKSCKTVGGPKKGVHYGGRESVCKSCAEKLKPIWAAEDELKELKRLTNKLNKERLTWQRSLKQAS